MQCDLSFSLVEYIEKLELSSSDFTPDDYFIEINNIDALNLSIEFINFNKNRKELLLKMIDLILPKKLSKKTKLSKVFNYINEYNNVGTIK